SATLGGNVTSDGGLTISERGVVYAPTSTNSNPLIGGSGVTKVTTTGTTGVFTVPVSGLTGTTGYSYKAYATNSSGTSYTSFATFTTANAAPVVVTPGGTTLTFTENGSAAAIDAGIPVSDDTANLAGATISITGNLTSAEDVLGFTNQNGITGSYNAST